MKNLKLKILLIIAIAGIFAVCMPIYVYGANENTVVVKKSDSEYMIYLKEYLEQNCAYGCKYFVAKKIIAWYNYI